MSPQGLPKELPFVSRCTCTWILKSTSMSGLLFSFRYDSVLEGSFYGHWIFGPISSYFSALLCNNQYFVSLLSVYLVVNFHMMLLIGQVSYKFLLVQGNFYPHLSMLWAMLWAPKHSLLLKMLYLLLPQTGTSFSCLWPSVTAAPEAQTSPWTAWPFWGLVSIWKWRISLSFPVF